MTDDRRFLFVLASARRDGNSEALARHAAEALPSSTQQRWLRLLDLDLPEFEDIRHDGPGAYAAPEGDAAALLDATLWATDLVMVVPVYWYSVPARAKNYLDHWSGWMRVPGADFTSRMAGKTLWAVSAISDEDRSVGDPLVGTLALTAAYMEMRWAGCLFGFGNRVGEVLDDAVAMRTARTFFASNACADGLAAS